MADDSSSMLVSLIVAVLQFHIRVEAPADCDPPSVLSYQEKIITLETIKWFNGKKSFGFISQKDGDADVFVHYSAIQTQDFRSLDENQQIEFEIAQNPKSLQTKNVHPV